MAAFSPLAFAVAHASTQEHGLLFIETSNAGSGSRYNAELHDLGEDVIDILSSHDVAIINDMTLAQASAKLNKLVAEYNQGSCLSISAIFIKPNGQIAAAWCAGQDGKWMSHVQNDIHIRL